MVSQPYEREEELEPEGSAEAGAAPRVELTDGIEVLLEALPPEIQRSFRLLPNALSVIEVVMISSPGFGLTAATAIWIAADPEVHAYAYFAPNFSANFCSSSLPNFPLVVVSVPERKASVTYAISVSSNVRPDAS